MLTHISTDQLVNHQQETCGTMARASRCAHSVGDTYTGPRTVPGHHVVASCGMAVDRAEHAVDVEDNRSLHMSQTDTNHRRSPCGRRRGARRSVT
jgi:hypothetical protein